MKITTIKDIVTSSFNKKGDEVHFIGEVVTKKESKWKKEKFTQFLIQDGNFALDGLISSEKLKDAYSDMVKNIQIGKEYYFEGKLDLCRKEFSVNITNASKDIFLKQLEHEEESVEIQLFKYIAKGDEKSAINILKESKDINPNFEFCECIPLFSAINNKMFKLSEELLKHPKINTRINDGFGETLLESLLYLYGSDEIAKSKEERDYYKGIIDIILKLDTYDFNAKDMNDDVAIGIACEYPMMLWVVEALAAKKNVDINIIDEFNCSPLTNCIRNRNLKALEIISKREDLIVRDRDREMAKEKGIDLSKYGLK